MLGVAKCAVVSAVLSAGVVGVVHPPGKLYTDRLPVSGEAPARAAPAGLAAAQPASPAGRGTGAKGDRLAAAGCDGAAWPYIPAPCIQGAGASERPVRLITVERRADEGVSVLARVPAPSTVAERR